LNIVVGSGKSYVDIFVDNLFHSCPNSVYSCTSVVMFSALMFVHKGFSLPLHHAQHYFLFWSKALVQFLNYGHQYVGLTLDLLVLSGFQQEIDHYSYFEF
jgi:hypothetical protein